MAGIYIPNMQMPNGAIKAWFGYDADDHPQVLVYTERDKDPELYDFIFVPDHGRLIDGDKIAKTFREDADEEWNRFATPVNWADAFDDVANMIDDEPTIIPADKEETK